MNKPVIKPQKDIDKVVLKFADGTEQELDKCMVVSLKPTETKDGDEVTMTVDCCHIIGESYQTIMYGMIQLASQTLKLDEDDE